LPRRVLPFARGEHLTENDFINFVRRNAGTFKHGTDNGRAEFVGWRIGKVAIERTDGGARSAGNHD
jgi:hypothetical protein